MEFKITTINDIIHFNKIINNNYIEHLHEKILTIDYEVLNYKINNMRYECFDHIQSFDDLHKLKVIDILNFIIDNRYNVNNIIHFKKNKSFSDIHFQKMLNLKNIKSWFNYYSLIAIVSKSLAQKKED